VVPRAQSLLEESRELARQLTRAREQSGSDATAQLLDSAREIDGVRVISAQVELADAEEARALGDRLREKMGSGIAVYSAEVGERASIFAVVTDDLIQRGIRADAVIREVAALAGGKGGGRPHMAQAGVGERDRIPAALAAVTDIVRAIVSKEG